MQLSISSDLEHLILERATAMGFSSAETYLRVVLAAPGTPQPENVSAEEFERLLDELADEDVPTLPDDFSRADIYREESLV